MEIEPVRLLGFPLLAAMLLLLPAHVTAGDIGERLSLCADIHEDGDRLVCFDALTTQLQAREHSSATPSHQETALAPSTPRSIHKAGEKYLSRLKDQAAEPVEYQYVLVDAKQDSRKRWKFFFQNGQIWRQLEARPLPRPRSFPLDATISVGFMDSYSLRFGNSNRAIKVKRLPAAAE